MPLAISDVRTGIAGQLQTIAGLRTASYLPDSINPPIAVVGYPDPYTYDEAMGRGLDSMELSIFVYVGRASDRASQGLLDAYLSGTGDNSIKTAIEADRTLDGTAQTCRVTEVTEYGIHDIGSIQYLGARVHMEIYG